MELCQSSLVLEIFQSRLLETWSVFSNFKVLQGVSDPELDILAAERFALIELLGLAV